MRNIWMAFLIPTSLDDWAEQRIQPGNRVRGKWALRAELFFAAKIIRLERSDAGGFLLFCFLVPQNNFATEIEAFFMIPPVGFLS